MAANVEVYMCQLASKLFLFAGLLIQICRLNGCFPNVFSPEVERTRISNSNVCASTTVSSGSQIRVQWQGVYRQAFDHRARILAYRELIKTHTRLVHPKN